MERELKIVLTIFMVFFLYGLTTLFNSGAFITPFFLNNAILLSVALLFYLLNFQEKNSLFLFLYLIALFANTLLDPVTALFISAKLNSDVLINLLEQNVFVISCIVLFFSFFIFMTYRLYRELENKWIALLLLVFVVLSLIFLGTDFVYLPQLLMSIFLLGFFVSVQRSKVEMPKVVEVISIQFLLMFLLSSFEYFI